MFAPIAGQLRRTNNGSEDQPEWGNFLSDFRKGQPMAFIFFYVCNGRYFCSNGRYYCRFCGTCVKVCVCDLCLFWSVCLLVSLSLYLYMTFKPIFVCLFVSVCTCTSVCVWVFVWRARKPFDSTPLFTGIASVSSIFHTGEKGMNVNQNIWNKWVSDYTTHVWE